MPRPLLWNRNRVGVRLYIGTASTLMPAFSTDLPLTKVVMLFFNPAGARAATADGAMTTVFSFTTAVKVYFLKWSP